MTCTGGPELVSWPAVSAALLATLLLSGCPDGKRGGPPKLCATAYEQCVLPNGVLGVCDSVECSEGQPAPCLVCRSQH